MIPNPWILLAIVLLWGASLGGMYLKAHSDGVNECQAADARDVHVAETATKAATDAAAAAISKIEVKNTTIHQKVQHDVIEKAVYRECRHDAGSLRNLNEALTGAAEPAGGGVVPAADAARR